MANLQVTNPLSTDLQNVNDGSTSSALDISTEQIEVNGSVELSGTADASSSNEIFFTDNGQIRSFDDNHRIIFHRGSNLMELREFNNIALMPGGSVGVGTTAPQAKLDVSGDLHVSGRTQIGTSSFCSNESLIVQNNSDGDQMVICRNNSAKIASLGVAANNYSNAVAGFGMGGSSRATPDNNAAIVECRGSGQNGINFKLNGSQKVRIDSNGNVGIGTTQPNAAALLQMDSTTQGFLPPRMTTTQRNNIQNTPEGLVVYDTTQHQLIFWNGSNWWNCYGE